ncbi:TBC1 domain, member 5 [Gryganskiella cystojenkinii]|nr:TBC1 domain, member 5 [Gryganskiella cystojenkinii]
MEQVLTSLALDPNKIRDKDRRTMLMVAATENKHLVLRYLLSLPSIQADLPDDEGETALYQASAAGSTECVHLLLLAGASASLGNEESITPLIIASYNGFVTICRLIMTLGQVDVNQQDNTQKSALLLASYAGHIEIMAELIDHGADLDMLDQYGWSSLMLAAYAGRLEACKLLLDHGADAHIKTSNGKNARNLSSDAGHRTVAAYISRFVQSGGAGSHMGLKPIMTPPRSPSRRTHSPAPSLPSVPEETGEDVYQRTTRHSFSGHTNTSAMLGGHTVLRRQSASTASSPPVSMILQLETRTLSASTAAVTNSNINDNDINYSNSNNNHNNNHNNSNIHNNTRSNDTGGNSTIRTTSGGNPIVNSSTNSKVTVGYHASKDLVHNHLHRLEHSPPPPLSPPPPSPTPSGRFSPTRIVTSTTFATLFKSSGKPTPPLEIKMMEFPRVSDVVVEQGFSSPPLSSSSSSASSMVDDRVTKSGSQAHCHSQLDSSGLQSQQLPPLSRGNSGSDGCKRKKQKASSVKSLSVKWAEVFEDPNLTLDSLKARALSQHSNPGSDGIRSVCWKVYLSCLPTLEVSTWPFALSQERERYAELRRKYIKAVGSDDGPEPDLEVNNPLSLAEDSPWQQFFVDSELRKIIQQDVERTFPDNDYFRSEKVQEQMGDILFIYCKINHDVSYRQGMHELVAHLLWVVSSESLDINAELETSSNAAPDVMQSVLNSNYVEHDTFALFSSLMSRAKPWYEFSDEGFSSKRAKPTNNNGSSLQPFAKPEQPEAPAGKQTPVIEWSMKIFHHLKRIDNELYLHLHNLEIQPQLFGIRWFRLLFGREFPMDEVFVLWDGIFAKDPSLKICIFIGVAMLLHIRDDLLEGDFAMCLHRLMRYPSIKDIHIFIPQALRLQEMPNPVGGQEIIRQNNIQAGKAVPPLPPAKAESELGSPQHRSEGLPQANPYAQQHYHPQPQQHQQHSQHFTDQSKSQILFPGNGVLSQHLPPAALDAIKPVAEGFVHVTKNVLESKGGAAINKAIHDMRKNTQSYIRKSNSNASSSPAAPNFPPMFDQAITSTGRLAASSRPAAPSPPKAQQATGDNNFSDKQVQSQLGQIMAKALVIFESEFFSSTSGNETENVQGGSETGKVPSKSAVAAFSGLEHVKDYLLGFSREVDSLVIESRMLETPPTQQPVQTSVNEYSISRSSNTTPSQDPPTAGTSSSPGAGRRLPVNAGTTAIVPRTTTTPSSTSPSPGRSPARESLGPDRRDSPQYSNSTTPGSERRPEGSYYAIDPTTVAASAPTRSKALPPTPVPEPEVAPTPPVIPPTPPKPFSFDDLISDPLADVPSSSSSSTTPRRGKIAGLTGGIEPGSGSSMSKIKSPRSSLAHSQFSWMLNDSPGITTPGSPSSISKTSGGLRPAAEISGRPGIDPLAGNGGSSSGSSISSKRSGGGGSGLGSSILLQQEPAKPRGEDPLRT